MYFSKPATAFQKAWDGVAEAGRHTLLDTVSPLARHTLLRVALKIEAAVFKVDRKLHATQAPVGTHQIP
eukprot:1134121-Pelagomonas_calceolata.AAC.1